MKESIKLQKYVSECGIMSRRNAEIEIAKGAFRINKIKAKLGDRVVPGTDVVEYNGEKLMARDEKLYIMLNKPAGVITTLSDELGRKTARSLIDIPQRLFPVGRLDKDTEGLLLFTDDGEFANRVSHPRYGKTKNYFVHIGGFVPDDAVDGLKKMRNIDGEAIRPAGVKIAERSVGATLLIFTLSEGKSRQIRRMCEIKNLKITKLRRFAIGGLQLGNLKKGAWRFLTPKEIKELMGS